MDPVYWIVELIIIFMLFMGLFCGRGMSQLFSKHFTMFYFQALTADGLTTTSACCLSSPDGTNLPTYEKLLL